MIDQRHLDRLDALLEDRSLEAVWFARTNTFAWLTGGSNTVDLGSEVGVAAVGYDGDDLEVVTSNNERDRFRSEQLPTEVTIRSFDWWESSLAAAVADRSPRPAAADFAVPGLETVDASVLRRPFTAADVDLARPMGTDVATAFETACRKLTSDTTERRASAILHRELVDAGFAVPCVLIGGQDRALKHRHFTPTSSPLGNYAIVTAGVERHGMYDSITRIVAFDPPDWLAERHEVTARVHATALAATRMAGRNGGTTGDVFEAIQRAYTELGHPDEWRNHHQGGAAGFAMREYIAAPHGDVAITLPMTFAWNPTIPGAKSEETVLVTESDCELLTRTDDWPRSTYAAVGYDFEISLNDVLF